MARPRKNAPKPNTQELSLVPVEEQPYPLPEGWKWVRLGSIADILNGFMFKSEKYVTEGIRIIRISNVQDGFLEDDKPVFYPLSEHQEIEKFMLSPYDLLISLTGNVGRTAIIYNNLLPAAVNQRVLRVRIKNRTLLNYIFYFTQRKQFQNECIANSKGSAQLNLSSSYINSLAIPLPPLDEQERIVTRIESLFTKLDEAKEKAESVLDSYETRKAAILHKAFTGELTAKWREEKGVAFEWKEKTLADIGTIVTGSTPSTKHPEYYGKEVPFIKPTDLNAGRYVIQSTEYLSKEGVKVSRPVKAGSTCVCCIGATISKCGFLLCNAVTNQQINTICPCDFMHGLFVYYWCTSSTFKQTLIENSSATTLPIINKSRMSALPIPVPTLPEQQEITRILDSLLEKEQQSKEAAETVLEQIDLMKKAILAKAFRGELG